jgi:hypothetical protein
MSQTEDIAAAIKTLHFMKLPLFILFLNLEILLLLLYHGSKAPLFYHQKICSQKSS